METYTLELNGLIYKYQALPSVMGEDFIYDFIQGRKGTLQNMSQPSTDISGWAFRNRPGGYGCILFDGTDDNILTSGLLNSPSSITVMAWANLVTPDTFGAEIISLGDYVSLRLDDSGKYSCSYYIGSSNWNVAEMTVTMQVQVGIILHT